MFKAIFSPIWPQWALSLLGMLLVGCCIALPYLAILPQPDESTHLYEAWRVSQGALPYRDFFSFLWPGTPLLLGSIARLNGFGVFGLRLLSIASLLLCTWLTHRLTKPFLPSSWQLWLLGILWLVSVPRLLPLNHHGLSTVCGLAAVACVSRFLAVWLNKQSHKHSVSKRPWLWLAAAGSLSGLSMLFTQSLGMLLIVLLGTFVAGFGHFGFIESRAQNRLRQAGLNLLGFLLPASGVILGMLGWLWQQGLWPDFWQQTVVWLFGGSYQQTTSNWYYLEGFTKLLSYGQGLLKRPDAGVWFMVYALLGGLPVLGLLGGSELLLRTCWFSDFKKNSGPKTSAESLWQLGLLVVSGMGFALATLSYPNSMLIAYHGWLLYGLAAISLVTWLARFKPIERAVLNVSSVLVALVLVFQVTQSIELLAKPRITAYGTAEKQFLAPAEWSASMATGYNQLLGFIQKHSSPADTLFIFNSSPEIYFLSNRQNPTRYQLVMHLYTPDWQLAEIRQRLHQAPPAFMLYDHVDVQDFRYDLRFKRHRNLDFRLWPVLNLIETDYDPAAALAQYTLFIRKSTVSSTTR